MGLNFPDGPFPGDEYVYGGLIYEFNGYGWDRKGQEDASMPDTSPPSDGDKGDITVSGGGYIWMLDPAVVTAAGRALIDDADAAAQRVTLGLGNVNNTPDATKPISAATQAALNLKYDKTGGVISGAATVTGALAVQADLYVTNGRIVNFGAEGSPERSYLFLNQSGSKSLYNDGISVGFYGSPVKVHSATQSGSPSTGAFTVAGGVGVGLNLQVGGAVNVAGTMNVVGQTVTRSLANVDGVIWNYGYAGNLTHSVIYLNQAGSKYIHQDGTYIHITGSRVAVNDATEATAPSAAALQVAGGLGVAKQILSGGAIRSGTTLQSTGYTFCGSSGTHYLGPADANTEYHVYASGHYWSYNRSNGVLVWSNGSGAGLVLHDNGVAEAKGFSTTGTIYTSGAGSFGSLTVGGAASFGSISTNGITCTALTCNGNLSAAQINGTDIYASGIIQSTARLSAYADPNFGFVQGGGYRYQHFASNFYWLYNQGSGALNWCGPGGESFVNFRQDASLLLAYQRAYMPGGGPWGDASDERIKNVQGDYELGLDEIKQLQPVRYSFKGNETSDPPAARVALPGKEQIPAPKSAPYPNSPHYAVAQDGQEFVGLIAQEVEAVFPGMVTQREGFIDGAAVTDLRDLNTTELIFALVNAVKTLAARVEALEAPV